MNEADQRLWHAWRKRRDEHAFETLVRPHLAFATDFARRLGCVPADADDLVQQALSGLAAEKSGRPLQVGLRAWLGRSLVLQVKMLRRARSRRAKYERAVRPSARDLHEDLESREEVEALLRDLPDPQREAVILRYLHDMDYEDIAFVTGASVNACRLRVHKGIERMRHRSGTKVGAVLAALPLLPGRSDKGLVAGALATSAPIGLVIVGGALVVKKTIIAAVVLACVAGSFYMLGESRGKRAPVPDRTPVAVDTVEEPAVEEKTTAQPAPVREETRKKVARAFEGLSLAAMTHVSFSPREVHLNDRNSVEWQHADKASPSGPLTGIYFINMRVKEKLPELAALGTVVDLSVFGSDIDDEDLAQIASMSGLAYLTLGRTNITDEGLAYLHGMTGLRRLVLHNTKITDEGLRHLSGLTALEFLDLHDNRNITDEGLTHLRGLTNLKSVRVNETRVTEKGLAILAELPMIEEFYLDKMSITHESLAHLARVPRLRKLRVERFQTGALEALRRMPALEYLNLSDGDAGDDDLAHIAGLKRLRRLNVEETRVTGAGLRHIAGLSALEYLNLSDTRLSDESLAHLAGLMNLKTLRLDNTGITDRGLAHLTGLTALERLDIDENAITDASIDLLARFKSLARLDLKDTKITPEGLDRLQKALPGTRIRAP